MLQCTHFVRDKLTLAHVECMFTSVIIQFKEENIVKTQKHDDIVGSHVKCEQDLKQDHQGDLNQEDYVLIEE